MAALRGLAEQLRPFGVTALSVEGERGLILGVGHRYPWALRFFAKTTPSTILPHAPGDSVPAVRARVGPKGRWAKILPLVEKLAGPLVRDMLFVQPQGVVHRTLTHAANAREGEVQTLKVRIEAHFPSPRANLPWRIRTYDGTGFLTLVFFKGGSPHLQRQHPAGEERVVSGKVERFGGELQMAHPDYILPVERETEIPEVEAVYPATAGLSSRVVRKLALEALERAPKLPEWLDPAFLAREKFPSWREALDQMHAPRSEADLMPQAVFRRRLAYDELFAHQLAMAQRKQSRRKLPAVAVPASDTARALEAALPFALTGAQVRAQAEIRADLAAGERMSRLLQGRRGLGQDRGGHAGHGRRGRRRPPVGADGAHRNPRPPALRDHGRPAGGPGVWASYCSPDETRARAAPRSSRRSVQATRPSPSAPTPCSRTTYHTVIWL